MSLEIPPLPSLGQRFKPLEAERSIGPRGTEQVIVWNYRERNAFGMEPYAASNRYIIGDIAIRIGIPDDPNSLPVPVSAGYTARYGDLRKDQIKYVGEGAAKLLSQGPGFLDILETFYEPEAHKHIITWLWGESSYSLDQPYGAEDTFITQCRERIQHISALALHDAPLPVVNIDHIK